MEKLSATLGSVLLIVFVACCAKDHLLVSTKSALFAASYLDRNAGVYEILNLNDLGDCLFLRALTDKDSTEGDEVSVTCTMLLSGTETTKFFGCLDSLIATLGSASFTGWHINKWRGQTGELDGIGKWDYSYRDKNGKMLNVNNLQEDIKVIRFGKKVLERYRDQMLESADCVEEK